MNQCRQRISTGNQNLKKRINSAKIKQRNNEKGIVKIATKDEMHQNF